MSNRNPEVDSWLANYANPQHDLVAKVREFIMDVSPELAEAVKWQAPTFMYKGNIASFFPRSKKNVTLMFHQGASLDDPHSLLEGDGETSRVARFLDDADFEAKKPALEAVILAWIRDHS
ncbi:DUF1801 domain-containing protein [Arthrobacter sp. HS15c]|jgi:hypothetical protein|uniref:DUF1801 domain-containing protein n=1 Tax=Arthrobacter sp. HS15c TaxID=3230279 RepID=UPI0034679235